MEQIGECQKRIDVSNSVGGETMRGVADGIQLHQEEVLTLTSETDERVAATCSESVTGTEMDRGARVF